MPCWSEPTLEPPCGHASEASIREPTAQMGHASPCATHIQQHADAEGSQTNAESLSRTRTRRSDSAARWRKQRRGGRLPRLAPDDSRRIKATYVFGATNCLFDQGLVLGGREGVRGPEKIQERGRPASGGRPRAAARDPGCDLAGKSGFPAVPCLLWVFCRTSTSRASHTTEDWPTVSPASGLELASGRSALVLECRASHQPTSMLTKVPPPVTHQ